MNHLFSVGTVSRAVSYYEDVKELPYRTNYPATSDGFHHWYFSAPGDSTIAAIVDALPESAREMAWGVAAWKWPALLIALCLTLLLMTTAYRLQRRYAKRWRHKSIYKYGLTIVFPIVAMLAPLGFEYVIEDYLSLRGNFLYSICFIAKLITFSASIIVVFGMSNRVAEAIIASPKIHPQDLDAQLIRIVSKLVSLVLSVIIFLAGGQHLGIHLTTLLASAGIGGIAFALAAQDTLKDLWFIRIKRTFGESLFQWAF